MMQIVEYMDEGGSSPFASWFSRLDVAAATRVTVQLARMASGNLATAKAVGEGVLEMRIDYGPGYRLYFGREGGQLVILLAGGTKQRQQADIAVARRRWQDYRQRRKGQAPTC